jgi:hypothetical protein
MLAKTGNCVKALVRKVWSHPVIEQAHRALGGRLTVVETPVNFVGSRILPISMKDESVETDFSA